MKKLLLALLTLALGLPAFAGLTIGELAPDFTLPDIRTDEDVSLSDFRGQVVVLQLMKCN